MNIFLRILSPTWCLADYLKGKCDSKEQRKKLIKLLNSFYLTIGVIFIVLIVFYQNLWLPSQSVKPPYVLYKELPFLWYIIWVYFLISRCNEIFFAFLVDAVAKIKRNTDPSSSLEFYERLKLAFKSYFELIINFAILFSLMPESFFWGGRDGDTVKTATDIVDALYYSAATITTLSDGTITPQFWFIKLLTIYEIFCGFSLLIVCFTIYTSRAIEGNSTLISNEKFEKNRDQISAYSVTVKELKNK